MAERVFQAIHANLMVPFTKAYAKNFANRPVVRKNAKFVDARCVLDDTLEEDRVYIDLLEKHPDNMANGGRLFQELTPDIISAAYATEGKAWAVMPVGGLTEPDIKGLQYLSTIPANAPPVAKKKWCEVTITLFDRFKIAGIPKPMEQDSIKTLRSKITLMFDLLAERKIWVTEEDDEPDLEGETTAGSGKA